jgi:heme-degrading monooxygenase HmoA
MTAAQWELRGEEANMIIRFWRAVAGSDAVLDAYAAHLKRTTFVEMAELPGHLGATLARKVKGKDNELVVVSFWKDLESAAHFQQGDFDDAVVKPSTQKLLKSFDLKVEYFETLASTGVVGGHDALPEAGSGS